MIPVPFIGWQKEEMGGPGKAIHRPVSAYSISSVLNGEGKRWDSRFGELRGVNTSDALTAQTEEGGRYCMQCRGRSPKEGSFTTRPTIQKILEDHGVLPKAYIIISIRIYVK
jgi:hypothetical protein